MKIELRVGYVELEIDNMNDRQALKDLQDFVRVITTNKLSFHCPDFDATMGSYGRK